MPIIVRRFIIKKFLLIFLLPLFALYPQNRGQAPGAPAVPETDVTFRDFRWGTSMEDVIRRMGNPVSREEVDGLVSLVWENVRVNEYTAFMIAYFSPSGLQGGTYFFLTNSRDEIINCYRAMRDELRIRHGSTYLFDSIIWDSPPWESSWHLPGGYVYLKASTQRGDPVTLWVSSPDLTARIFGEQNPTTARR
jgi:hypothetical protein